MHAFVITTPTGVHFAYTSVNIALRRGDAEKIKRPAWAITQATERGISGNYAKGDNAEVEQRPIALFLSVKSGSYL